MERTPVSSILTEKSSCNQKESGVITNLVAKKKLFGDIGNIQTLHSQFDGLYEEARSSDSEVDTVDKENTPVKRKKRGRPFGKECTQECNTHCPDIVTKKKKRDTKDLAGIFCCTALCISALSEIVMEKARTTFTEMSMTGQRDWIFNYFREHSQHNDGEYTYIYTIGSLVVCWQAWYLILGISRSRFMELKKTFEDHHGKFYPVKPNFGKLGVQQQKTKHVVAWLAQFIDKMADKLPNSNKLHLPTCLTRQDIYKSMVEDLLDINEVSCSESHFYALWRKQFRHVIIPKENSFAKCEKCTAIKDMWQATREKIVRLKLREKKERHLLKQNTERQKYYKHIQKAKKYPKKYLSIIIDGMDQSKTQLPHFVQIDKFTSQMERLSTHVTGIIMHGLACYGFFDNKQWPHSSNLTINLLMASLYMWKEELPPTLYLQLDNTARENKNKFVFAFCCLLIERKIFKKVKVSFLMVGHTHEDVDQMFSRFSFWLNTNKATTMIQLVNGFERAYTPRPTGIVMSHYYDVSGWLLPHMEIMSQHSRPHIFRFTSEPITGKAVIHTKKWSTDKEWMSTAKEDDTYLLKSIPTGYPKLVKPDYENSRTDMAKLAKDIEVSKKYMSQEDGRWWDNWLSETNDIDSTHDEEDISGWYLDQFSSYHDRTTPHVTDVPPHIQTAIDDLGISDEDTPIREVVIGKKPGKQNRKNLPVLNTIKVGDLCLLDTVHHEDWPQIGKALSINGSQVDIHWYCGAMSTAWTPLTRPKPGCRGQREAWTETVLKENIWKFGFKFTESKKLPKSIKDAINDYE